MKSISIEKAVEIALEQHQAGQFERAESLYMEILRQDPGNVDAMHLLGVLAFQGKNAEAAIKLIQAAISRKGDVPVFHYNLAESLRTLKRNDQAIASYRRAVELEPGYQEAYNNLSIALNDDGKFEDAAIAAQAAIDLDVNAAAPWNNLGNAYRGLGKLKDAESAYRSALAIRPEFADCVNNLAMIVCTLGNVEEGLELFRRAIQLIPTGAVLHSNLGATLSRLGQHQEAVNSFQQALDLDPKNAEAQNNLGGALRSLNQNHHALKYFRQAIELAPNLVAAHANLAASLKDLGKSEEALVHVARAIELSPFPRRELFLRALILRELKRTDEAIDVYRQVLEIAPEDVQTLTALGYALQERGQLDEAMLLLKKSTEFITDPSTHSNLLMTINYHPGYSPADLLAAHQGWAEKHEKPHRPGWPIHSNARDPNRKLRIGYVSPDFRGHVVAHFLEPILDHHNHEQFEIYGYAHLLHADAHTWRLRSQIDHWREIANLPATAVAKMIREDQIDILVELAGHTGGNLLPVFARKPAPVQINMIGFPSTTGLTALDYRITDERCDPTGIADPFNTEKLIRIPGLFWVYQPSEIAPEVGPLPADKDQIVTFTSVNNFTKVTPQVQRWWAEILAAVPNSRLIVQTTAMTSEQTRQAVTALFQEHGVAVDRLDFRGWTDAYKYFCLLNESDMTLDPFPFNGGTTTCHSLWMGVPVVTLAGDRHASRMGLSMMSAIGLPEFVAHTPEEYVQIAVKFANDLPRLRQIRAGMRDRLKASPLLDAPGYTRNLEAAFRQVWRTWCAS